MEAAFFLLAFFMRCAWLLRAAIFPPSISACRDAVSRQSGNRRASLPARSRSLLSWFSESRRAGGCRASARGLQPVLSEVAMFEFCTHARTLVGAGASDALGETLAARWGASRVLLVTDGALVSLGLAGRLRDALASAGHTVAMFDEVVADPPESVVERAIIAARDARAQVIVGFGGGSSMDVAKLAAAFAGTTQDLRQAYGIGLVAGPRLPLVQVPTTAGTGSEATPIAVVTTGDGAKAGVISPVLYADLAVLDATLTLGLPPAITAATGIDAMVHATEAYTSRVLKNPISDALAREALRLLFRALPLACRDGGDLAARQDMLLARRSPMRRWVPCMRWPIRWAAHSMCRTGCPTPWCWGRCCGSIRCVARPSTRSWRT